MHSSGADAPSAARPLIYQVVFRGEVGPALREAFSDFDVRPADGVTVLHCELPDQAALFGVLERVEALGLELVSVCSSEASEPAIEET